MDEMESIHHWVVETLSHPLPVRGHLTIDLGICVGLAMGLPGPFKILSPFVSRGHSDDVDGLLSGRMARPGGGSAQRRF